MKGKKASMRKYLNEENLSLRERKCGFKGEYLIIVGMSAETNSKYDFQGMKSRLIELERAANFRIHDKM